jgi:hypothetical protein
MYLYINRLKETEDFLYLLNLVLVNSRWAISLCWEVAGRRWASGWWLGGVRLLGGGQAASRLLLLLVGVGLLVGVRLMVGGRAASRLVVVVVVGGRVVVFAGRWPGGVKVAGGWAWERCRRAAGCLG